MRLARAGWLHGRVDAMRDLVHVAESISHHRSTVAVRGVERLLQTDRSCVERALVRGVGVVDVDVQECREGLAFGG
jgi:hypothetical protein